MRSYSVRAPRVPLAFLLGAVCASGTLACGEEVMVGRWVLRASPVDAGVAADAGAPRNPQSEKAEQARERAREHDANKNDGHDARPGEKSHQ